MEEVLSKRSFCLTELKSLMPKRLTICSTFRFLWRQSKESKSFEVLHLGFTESIRSREQSTSLPKNQPNREFWQVRISVLISKKIQKIREIPFTETESNLEEFWLKKNTNICFLFLTTKATDTDIILLLKTTNFFIKVIIKSL